MLFVLYTLYFILLLPCLCHGLCLHNPRHHYYYWFCYCDYHHHYYCYIYITPSTRTIVAVTIPTAIAATSAGV